ncbi:tetratricopeptide repeat protein [Alteromonas sp. CI.11.F.A3]|uniref:tetratricopeptide repeat protein n=1 Tax=Alteromonas sp. CI.11.F.A3 TaxID=3079555 RepID=UPI0029433122|nr:tetratricopeptide repeat protein [Alteromonas sp. CI.11.F.A3]WOI38938.1 tetratricopeptide repeat protein [Alteromonas sp. CI.11.F.A3]
MMKNITPVTQVALLIISLGVMSDTLAQDDVNQSSSDTLKSSFQQAVQSPLSELQHEWAHINYALADKQKENAFSPLIEKAKLFIQQDPSNPELIIWLGIIQSSAAGAKGGLDALSYAKAARKNFEHAMRLDEKALAGSAMTSLGVLYHKLPSWPISFGNDKKAKKLLEHALEINPDGIDPNYFYAEFLYDNGEYDKARAYVKKASQAPARTDRPLADLGRRQEISRLEDKLLQKS